MRTSAFIMLAALTCGSMTAYARSGEMNQPGAAFIENKGQFTDDQGRPVSQVLFKSANAQSDLWITTSGISYVFKQTQVTGGGPFSRALANADPVKITVDWSRVDMELVGAQISATNVTGSQLVDGAYNFYKGEATVTNVHECNTVTVKNVYAGIDWVIRSGEQGIKYDFIVHPGADASKIRLKYHRCDSWLDNTGALHVTVPTGEMTEERPVVFFDDNHGKTIASHFNLEAGVLSFAIGSYDHHKTIVIDPLQHVWATYYGGADYDNSYGLDADANGNVFMAGSTYSADFPTLDPGGPYFQGTMQGHVDSYVVKFDNNGVRLWATYFGGTSDEETRSIHIDGSGNLWMVGSTFSTDFPVQVVPGAYNDTTYGGESVGPESYWGDGFIAKFDNSGNRLWATYYGADSTDVCSSIKSDATGNVYVCGITRSSNFPTMTMAGAYNDTTYNGALFDAYVLKFTNTGARLWATYYGGTDVDYCEALDVTPAGELFVAGETMSSDFPVLALGSAYNQDTLNGIQNGYILKFSSAGAQLWGSYYGASYEIFFNVHVNGTKTLVVGLTDATSFPTFDPGLGAYYQAASGGDLDAVIIELDNVSCFPEWATYYGGAGPEAGYCATWDAAGNLIVAGEVDDQPLPIQWYTGAYNDTTFGGGGADGFLAGFDNQRNRFWSTYYYGDGYDFVNSAVFDNNGNLFISGESDATDSPVLSNGSAYYQGSAAGNTDAHIAKFAPVTTTGVANLAGGDQALSMYPNPTSGVLSIETGAAGDSFTLEVYAADGRRVISRPVSGQDRITIDLSGEANGVYFVRLFNGAFSGTGKITVQH